MPQPEESRVSHGNGPQAPRSSAVASKKGKVGYLPTALLTTVGSLIVAISLFLPWWSLHSSFVNGGSAVFSFAISPLGLEIKTTVGEPRALLAPLEILFVSVTILFLPISGSLALASVNGIYCVLCKRAGARTLIAPLWAFVALSWWGIYFLLIYSFFDTLGLHISPTGNTPITWGNYNLASVSWGWDIGLSLALVGTAILVIGAAISIAHARGAKDRTSHGQPKFSPHSECLVLLAISNLAIMVVLLALFHGQATSWLVAAPTTLLVVMAFLARHTVANGRAVLQQPSQKQGVAATEIDPRDPPYSDANVAVLSLYSSQLQSHAAIIIGFVVTFFALLGSAPALLYTNFVFFGMFGRILYYTLQSFVVVGGAYAGLRLMFYGALARALTHGSLSDFQRFASTRDSELLPIALVNEFAIERVVRPGERVSPRSFGWHHFYQARAVFNMFIISFPAVTSLVCTAFWLGLNSSLATFVDVALALSLSTILSVIFSTGYRTIKRALHGPVFHPPYWRKIRARIRTGNGHLSQAG